MNNQEQFLAGAIPVKVCKYPVPGFNYSIELAITHDGAFRVDGSALTEMSPYQVAWADRTLKANGSENGWFNGAYIPSVATDAEVARKAFVPVIPGREA